MPTCNDNNNIKICLVAGSNPAGQLLIYFHNVFPVLTKTLCRHSGLVPRSRIKAFVRKPRRCSPGLRLTTEVHNYNTRSTAARNYYVHNANLMKTRKAVTYAGSVAWNKLPNAIKEAQSPNVFKARLKAYLLENNETQISFN